MSGITLLFDAAIEYERTHQLVLFTLLKKSELGRFLLGIPQVQEVTWEPERQLFDLHVKGEHSQCFLEIKMWSLLGDNQLQRQRNFLFERNTAAGYILLGPSWFEHRQEFLHSRMNLTEGCVRKLGYEELIDSLRKTLVSPCQQPDVAELVLAYKSALEEQYRKFLDPHSWKDTPNQKLFYYSLYRLVQERLHGIITTRIGFANNPSGGVATLTDIVPHQSLEMFGVKVELYCELVNGRLSIKFHAETKEDESKYKIRDRVRGALREALGNRYTLKDSGRLGEYMTACQVEHVNLDTESIETVADVFITVHQAMPKITELVASV